MYAPDMHERTLEAVAAVLKDARRVLFVTGAGISADSGLPTYRGVSGLYNDEHCEDGIPIEAALSGEMFRINPGLTWKHIARIEEACRGARANRAHEVIAALEADGREVWVLTQNVDGLHARAGSTRVIDIHGDVSLLMCPVCDYREQVTDFSHLDLPPRCPQCRAVIRPDVVLFGEMLDPDKISTLQEQLARGFDVVFSVGTSSLFPYIQAPMHEAQARGTPTVEINPDTTGLSSIVDHRLPMGAAEAMQALYLRCRSVDTARDG